MSNIITIEVVDPVYETVTVEVHETNPARLVPPGGTTGQVLTKASDGDFDTEWEDNPAPPVDSVNGQTGAVVLGAADVGAYPDTNPSNFIDAGGAPVQGVTGDGVDNTDPANPVISWPDPSDIGAYPDSNPSGYVDASGASTAAPVQSVNTQTGDVVLGAGDVGAIPTSEKGAAGGVATLGADGKLASAQLVGTFASVLPLKGRYTRLGGIGSISVNTPPNNTLRLAQFSLPYDVPFDQIGVAWDISGEASSKVRIGIYGPLLPDMAIEELPLLLDAGFVDGSQAAGQYYITIDETIKAGIYFAATLNYDSPTTRPRMRSTSAATNIIQPFGSFGTTDAFEVNQNVGFSATVVGGAFPATLAALTINADRCNLVQARIKV